MKPRRSILSVPGHMKKMHTKALQSAADVIMLDLEDSVPVKMKVDARAEVIQSLLSMDWQTKTVTVRSNAIDTPYGYRDIIDIAEKAGNVLDAIVIPKVNHPGDIHFVHRLLDGIELNKKHSHRIGIEASIETAQGMEKISSIARASDRIVTLVFGIADYSASVGIRLSSISGHGEEGTDIYPGHRWHFPLSRMVMTARANGLGAIDAPYGNFKDRGGLERSAEMAKALGCSGKWVIHPGQIDIVNDVFSPSPADIERARKVIQAHEEAASSGQGAVSVNGRLVDNATIRLARQLLDETAYLT